MKRKEKERNFVPRAVALNCGVYDVRANKREMDGFMKELMPENGKRVGQYMCNKVHK